MTTPDGARAAQMVFVAEDADQAARDFLPDARELRSNNQPVPKPIQTLLRTLFGIEINLEVELEAWTDFIRRATLAIQA